MTVLGPADDELTERVARDCDAVIEAEVSRLRRRRPQLPESALHALDETLDELAERLLLRALRRNPGLRHSLAPVFAPARPLDPPENKEE